MPIAQIIDMPGAGAREYEQAFALIHPDGAWPAGQLNHIAGPSGDGFRVIASTCPLLLLSVPAAGAPTVTVEEQAHPRPSRSSVIGFACGSAMCPGGVSVLSTLS